MQLFDNRLETMIREASLLMEEQGTITPSALDVIYANGLFKLFVPEEYGGLMTPYPDALRIFEHASRINGSFGWLVTIGSGGGYFVSMFSPSVSRELFSPRTAVIAGSGTPSGEAYRVEGGYIVTGKWNYCSGSPYATVFTGTAVLRSETKDKDPQQISFAMRPDQVEIIRDWDAFGLHATASHTILAKDAFVPDRMVFHAPDKTYADFPIYRYPFLTFAYASFAAVCVGIGRHFFEEAKLLVQQNRVSWEKGKKERVSIVSEKLTETEMVWEEQVARFYQTVDASWQRHIQGEVLSENEQSTINAECKKTAHTILSCAHSLFPYLGLGAVMKGTLINQTYRDLQTVCQHSLFAPY